MCKLRPSSGSCDFFTTYAVHAPLARAPTDVMASAEEEEMARYVRVGGQARVSQITHCLLTTNKL